jgi:hypothetical protein
MVGLTLGFYVISLVGHDRESVEYSYPTYQCSL